MVKNMRPPVSDLVDSVPEWIRLLIPLCWAPLQDNRPDAVAVCEVLSLEIDIVHVQLSYWFI